MTTTTTTTKWMISPTSPTLGTHVSSRARRPRNITSSTLASRANRSHGRSLPLLHPPLLLPLLLLLLLLPPPRWKALRPSCRESRMTNATWSFDLARSLCRRVVRLLARKFLGSFVEVVAHRWLSADRFHRAFFHVYLMKSIIRATTPDRDARSWSGIIHFVSWSHLQRHASLLSYSWM